MTQACNEVSNQASNESSNDSSKGQSSAKFGPTTACADLSELLEPRLFRALSDPNRLTLMNQLAASPAPRTVGELDTCCAVDLSVVSRHLAVLREAGIVQAEKRGRQVYYSICCEPLAALLRGMADALDCCAANGCQPKEITT